VRDLIAHVKLTGDFGSAIELCESTIASRFREKFVALQLSSLQHNLVKTDVVRAHESHEIDV